MENNEIIFDKHYLMHTPLSFLLKTNSSKEISEIHDENGWTIMHYAVAELNIAKITEMLLFKLDFTINSKKNFIPSDVYILNEKKRTSDKIEIFHKIPFIKKGFTPIHLALFMYSYYYNLNRNFGGEFFYNNILEKCQKVLSILITEKTMLKNALDLNGKSYFDYAFLSENISLIELLNAYDPGYETLNKVDATTAKNIIKVMEHKYKEGSHDYIIRQLETKELKDQLELNLKKNKITETVKKV